MSSPIYAPKYHKIQSIWKRDPANKHKTFIEGDWSVPEFSCLANADWVFTEKVDGTNIRVWLNEDGSLGYNGKSDRAVLPKLLPEALEVMFSDLGSVMQPGFCMYGEGYGAGIQKGGGNYRPDKSFVLFDCWLGTHWMGREELEGLAGSLGCPITPVIGRGSLRDMADIVREGLPSTWGDFIAEGIVARPAMELRRRNGDRIITKVKCKDFGITTNKLQTTPNPKN